VLVLALTVTFIQVALDGLIQTKGAGEEVFATILDYAFLFLVNAVLLAFAQTALAFLSVIPLRKSAKSGNRLDGIQRPYFWLMLPFALGPALLAVPSLGSDPVSSVILGAPLLLGGAVQLFMIHVAFKRGRGPGLIVIMAVVAAHVERKNSAFVQHQYVLREHTFEKEFANTLTSRQRMPLLARMFRRGPRH
jgi:hypothetical protein